MGKSVDIDQLNLKFTAAAGNVGQTFSALESRLKRLSSAMSSVDTAGIDKLTNSFSRLSTAVNGFSANGTMDKSIRSLAKSLSTMQSVDVASVARTTIVLDSLGNSMRAFPVIDATKTDALRNLASALTSFSKVKSVSGISGISELGKSMQTLMSQLQNFDASQFELVSKAIRELAEALNLLGRTKAEKAIANLPKLSTGIKKLMNALARAPTISKELIQMTNALAQLSQNGAKVGTAANGLNKALNNTGKAGTSGARGLNLFNGAAKSSKRHIKDLASVVGGLIAKYWILVRAVQGLGKLMGLASSLTEVDNVVAHAFGTAADKVNEFSRNAIEAFGMSELSAKTYASRFQAMMTAMEIPDSAALSANQFIDTKISGILDENAEAYKNLGDSVSDVAINLTKLTADYASFFDVAQDDVAQKMQSILTGQTRPLREYGLDLTEATLKEWALKNGLDADISSMTQAEKAMLRYRYVMSQSSIIMGDFARTADTFHNTIVRLKENAKALGITIGEGLIQIFKPVLQWANAAIVALNAFAKTVSNSLGKILGWKKQWVEGGSVNSGYADEMEDIGDAAGGASKKVKELNKQLQGFDELNNLTTNDDNGGGGGGGGASGVGAGGASAAAGHWEDIEEGYESIYDTPFKLGEYISKSITDSLNGINWEDIKSKVGNFARGLAEFLNGLVTPEMLSAVGTALAEGLNTAFLAVGTFASTYDWTNLGKSVAAGITSAFSTFDAAAAGKSMHDLMAGLLTALTIAAEEADWNEIGKKIGDYIANLDIPDLLGKLATLAGRIAEGLITALIQVAENTTWQDKMGLAVLALLKFAKLKGVGTILKDLLSAAMPGEVGLGGKSLLVSGIKLAIAGVTWSIGSKIGTSLGEALALYFGDDDLADAYAAWADLTFPEKIIEIKTALQFVWEEIKESGVDTGLKEAGETVIDKLGGVPQTIWYGVKEMFGLNSHEEPGGSTTHTSESGVEHGGSGGKFGDTGSSTHISKDNVVHGGSSGKFNTYQTGYSAYEQFDKYGKQNTMPNPTKNDNTSNTSWSPFKYIRDQVLNIQSLTDELQGKKTTGKNETKKGGGASGPGYGQISNTLKIGKIDIPGAKEANNQVTTLNNNLAKLNKTGTKNTSSFSTNANKGFNSTTTAESKLSKETKTLTSNTPSWFQKMSTKVSGYTNSAKNSITNDFSAASKSVGTYSGSSSQGILGKVSSSFSKIFSKVSEGTKDVEPTVSQRFEAAATAVGTNTGSGTNGMLGLLKQNFDSMDTETKTKFGAMLTSVSTNTGGGTTGMLGVLRSNLGLMDTDTTNRFGAMKTTVENTKADAKFGVTAPKPEEVDKNMFSPLKEIWKDLTAKATIDAPTKDKTELKAAYDRRSAIWKPLKALAEIDAPTKNKRELESAYSGRKGIWQDYTANFNVSTEGTGEKLQGDWNYLTGNVWKDYSANFGVNVSASASSVDVARSALYKMSEAMDSTGNSMLAEGARQLRIQASHLYARGGVFDEATLGIFGEDGAEAVVPLEKNIGWAKNVADLITARMPLTAAAPPSPASNYAGTVYNAGSNAGVTNAVDSNAVALQNELLQQEVDLLKQIAAKDLTISSSSVFNAVRTENQNYYNRTGNSAFFN